MTSGVVEAPEAALAYPESPLEVIRGHVRFEWAAMDAWFEEDEQVFFHPRDPYTRVDILPSSRHVRVEVDGVTVADSRHARILFETGLPARYYLPKTDVRLDLLEHTDTVTHCPYKGSAEYWSVNGHAGSGVVLSHAAAREPARRRAWSPSTTRSSTSTSTVSWRSGRRRSSVDRSGPDPTPFH